MHTPTGQRQTRNSRQGRSSSEGVNLWGRSEARRQRAEAVQPVTAADTDAVGIPVLLRTGALVSAAPV